MLSLLTLLLSLFVIQRADGRRVKNIHYLHHPSNRILIRNRVEYIQLPRKGQSIGTIPYEKLSDLDKQFLDLFWSEIKKHKVDRMRKHDGLVKFHQIERYCLEVFKSKKKIEIAHVPSGENHTISINIPHSVLLMWDIIKEL